VTTARRRGWAVSSGEILPGATGVAAPIVVRDQPAEASISAVWVEPRDPAIVAEAVMRAATAIGAAL
jgi:DNA-binding IclR family transcriptional regulator